MRGEKTTILCTFFLSGYIQCSPVANINIHFVFFWNWIDFRAYFLLINLIQMWSVFRLFPKMREVRSNSRTKSDQTNSDILPLDQCPKFSPTLYLCLWYSMCFKLSHPPEPRSFSQVVLKNMIPFPLKTFLHDEYYGDRIRQFPKFYGSKFFEVQRIRMINF